VQTFLTPPNILSTKRNACYPEDNVGGVEAFSLRNAGGKESDREAEDPGNRVELRGGVGGTDERGDERIQSSD
jgi:hypothetical protein